MKRAELNFAQKVWLESLWLGARFFAVLPYWFKYYVVENLLFFILYYCLRYRMKVVNENLRNSFPEKSVGVKPGRKVYVTINSYRQKMVTVPYVAGRSLRQAKNMLEVAGLGIEQIVYRPDLATNYVLEEYADGKRVSEKSRVQLEAGSGVTLYVGESGSVSTLVPKTVGLHLQQAKSRLWELGLNIGKISFDEGINLLNQREARVYLQTPSAGSRARLGAKVDLKLTLDAAKVTAQSAAADKEMIKAAEELRRLDAETADSLARVRLDSLANRPVEAEPVIDDGLFPDEETAEDEFFQ